MRPLPLVLFGILFPLAACATTGSIPDVSPDPVARVEAGLEQRMKELGVPGLSVAVFRDGRIEWARGYGLAEVDAGRPVTSETLFQAASISKPVAATLALSLVEDGRLDLDAPVNDTLGAWQVPASPLAASSPVTLRGLLTHTAGLTVHGFGGYPAGVPVPSTVGVLAGEGNSAPVVVDLAPGTRWRYSGGGYTVMQLLVEEVTGQPFAQVMARRVLEPLGMERSTFEQPLPESLAGDAAVGYRAADDPVDGRWHTYPEQAAAGLWTTPSDLARWALAVQAGRTGEASPVLSKTTLDAMLTEGPLGHGLGPAIMDDGVVFGHGGANEGYRCTLRARVDGSGGVVVMTNSDGGGLLADELALTVARVYGWASAPRDEKE